MNGAEHFREAERLLTRASQGGDYIEDGYAAEVAAAQVHATLALAAATLAAAPKLYEYPGWPKAADQ